jgi:hypothetical protein
LDASVQLQKVMSSAQTSQRLNIRISSSGGNPSALQAELIGLDYKSGDSISQIQAALKRFLESIAPENAAILSYQIGKSVTFLPAGQNPKKVPQPTEELERRIQLLAENYLDVNSELSELNAIQNQTSDLFRAKDTKVLAEIKKALGRKDELSQLLTKLAEAHKNCKINGIYNINACNAPKFVSTGVFKLYPKRIQFEPRIYTSTRSSPYASSEIDRIINIFPDFTRRESDIKRTFKLSILPPYLVTMHIKNPSVVVDMSLFMRRSDGVIIPISEMTADQSIPLFASQNMDENILLTLLSRSNALPKIGFGSEGNKFQTGIEPLLFNTYCPEQSNTAESIFVRVKDTLYRNYDIELMSIAKRQPQDGNPKCVNIEYRYFI